MSIYSTNINVDGSIKKVVIINYENNENNEVSKINIDKLHHIHILDRSGSMYTQINNLIDNVQKTIEVISDDDLISIIWFSSPGQYRTLIKGAKKTDGLNKLLDSLRSTLGTTCFSDPLKETEVIINELYDLCPNISITLFTDGCPVVPWTIQEEESRIFKVLENIKNKIMSFNTIGFGNWYNKDLLLKMASFSEYGTFVHSSKIDDYLSIFNHNFEKISDVVMDSVEIVTGSADIIYLGRNFTKIEELQKDKDNVMKFTRLNKKKNQFFLVGMNDKDFDFVYQGEKYSSKNFNDKGVASATINNFLYSYSYNLYYVGRREESLNIIGKIIRDKYFVDSHRNSFTSDECSKHLKSLHSAIFDKTKRNINGECSSDYIPADNSPCVMDILGFLQKNDSFYVPFSKRVEEYKRITRKTTDDFNLFNITDKEVITPFSNFVYNKEHMNLSILLNIPGTVKLNPKSAKEVNLPSEIDSSIFRNHTIIKDGNLNTKEIEVLLPEDLKKDIENIAPTIVRETIEKVNNDNKEYLRCVLSLDQIPIINKMYIDRSNDIKSIFDIVNSITKLEARQKILGYYIDKADEAASISKKKGKFKEYTLNQIKVLEEHGLDKNLIYNGISKKRPSNDELDSYETRTMEFYISGCKAIPKVSDFLERISSGKKLTKIMEIMNIEMKYVLDKITEEKLNVDKSNIKLRNLLQDLLNECKKELIEYRNKLNTLKMAKIITGGWFPGLIVNDKGEYEYIEGEITMIAKVERTVEYF